MVRILHPAVQPLRFHRRAAPFAERLNPDRKPSRPLRKGQDVAAADGAARLVHRDARRAAREAHAAVFDDPRGKASRLEKAGAPQPHVDPAERPPRLPSRTGASGLTAPGLGAPRPAHGGGARLRERGKRGEGSRGRAGPERHFIGRLTAPAKDRALRAFAVAHARVAERAQDVMRVVAPPLQARKQRVGDVDRARALGPGSARERVEPLKLGDRRGELPDGAQAPQRERLRARRRARQRIERPRRPAARQGSRVRRRRTRSSCAFGSRSDGR